MDNKTTLIKNAFENLPYTTLLGGVGVGFGVVITICLAGLGYSVDIRNKINEKENKEEEN